MNGVLRESAAVVPVYNPEPGLQALCVELVGTFGRVVVVDDGSGENAEAFAQLPPSVTVLRHGVNRGKGRAIKTAIRWLLDCAPEIRVAVFVDGDGQHRPDDARAVAERARNEDRVVFGVRDFTGRIPFRSRFGNACTALLVRLIFGLRIRDTQTGLRAIPRRLFARLLELPGERYEYEMRIFGLLRAQGESLSSVPIRTVYIDGNRTSHFRPIVDSVRVYQGLFGGCFARFVASSVMAFLTDNAVFAAVVAALHAGGMARRYEILVALVAARAVSSTVNFCCNRKLVFRSASSAGPAFARYWLLVGLIAGLSYAGTAALSVVCNVDGVAITVLKIVVETALFALSYELQKRWVFRT